MDASERSASGYRTVSPDTNEAADRAYFEALRRLGPEGRALLVAETFRATERAALFGLRGRHPDADERELAMRLGVLLVGPELMWRAFRWRPVEPPR